MRKFVVLSSVLLFLSGFSFLASPAAALIPCDCEYCAGSSGGWCEDQETGIRLRCFQYTDLYCSGFAAATDKADKTELFPSDLFVSELDGRRCPDTPAVTPAS